MLDITIYIRLMILWSESIEHELDLGLTIRTLSRQVYLPVSMLVCWLSMAENGSSVKALAVAIDPSTGSRSCRELPFPTRATG
jgi:hypothetical protein